MNLCHYHFVIKECYMRFDDLIKILLGGICRLCRVVSPWSDRHPSYLYFLYTRVGELKVHLLLLHSSVLNKVKLGYLVMLLNQMKCSGYKIYSIFLSILNHWNAMSTSLCSCAKCWFISEWPMFCRSVDSFPFRQISGAQYVLFLQRSCRIFREFKHDLC